MWDDLFAAMALLFVFEGIMPFVSPARWRIVLRTVADQSDTALRIMGLSSMLMGAVLLYIFRQIYF
ncbi:MAG: DUF2065 domain-containing protein [Gammaproteobacteria bacterium 39-13]|nr:DUF2065 domain-containing protein [Gammaproteobacteria bacterium]OJV88104.1 MAG: DUF2065 domain-containing protein [Gammaproteobacteria bacterium 39-13]